MTMPRWATNLFAGVGVAAMFSLAGVAAAAETAGKTVAATQASAVQPPVAETLPPTAGEMHVSPWSDAWTDETWDDCIPPIWSHWTINLDAVFWRRSTPDDMALATSNPGANPNAKSLTFDNEAGPRLALIRRGISGWDVEINYVGIEGFHSELAMPNAFDLRVPSPTPGGLFTSDVLGIPITGMRLRYDSRLHSQELNLRRQLNDTWTMLLGIRAVQVFEDFDVDITSNFTPFYAIETENRLFGLQIGGDGKLFCTERFLLTTSLKAGLFENHSEQTTSTDEGSLLLANTSVSNSLSASTNQASFVGEIGLVGTYRVSETILLRAGYNVMWVDDLSLASEQVVVNQFQTSVPPPRTELRGIRADGSLLYHGASVGVELTW